MNSDLTPDVDDTVCAHCGKKLEDNPKPGSFSDHGFCCFAHTLLYTGTLQLLGQVALEVAQAPGRDLGGPGFESWIIRDWLREARPDAPAFLLRQNPHDIWPPDRATPHKDCWVYTLQAGGGICTRRLIRKLR